MFRIKKSFKDNYSKLQLLAGCFVTVCLIIVSVSLIRTFKGTKSYNVDFGAIQETVDEDGTGRLMLRGLSLRKGTYSIVFGYVADSDSKVEIALDNDTYLSDVIPATYGSSATRDYKFELKTGTDRGRIDFTYPSGSKLNLAFITINSEIPMYYDGLIFGILLLVLIPFVWMGMYFYNRSTHKISLIVAVVMVIIQVLPFIARSGLNLGIDLRGHMMRIEGIYYGLLDGQFPVVIYPEWNNSYGQMGVLYPNVFLYIPAVFRLMGMSQLGACKFFMYLIICTSAVIALASARTIFKKEWQICLAVTVLSLDNMRLFDMLGDGRIGGALLAEMFYPLVIAGLIEIFYQNRRKWYLLAYGIAGVFCSHIVSATIVCIGVLLFAVCAIKRLKDTTLYCYIGRAILLFTGLIFGTAVCFVKFYFSDWGQDKLQWEDFVATLWPRGTVYDDRKWIFIIVLFIICLASLVIVKIRGRLPHLVGTFVIPAFVSGTILFWMSTRAFPWVMLRKIPAIEYYTNMLQDSFRFITFADVFLIFCACRILEEVVLSVEGRQSYKSKTLLCSMGVIVILCLINFIQINLEYFTGKSTLYYDAVIGDIEFHQNDYLPAGTDPKWYESDAGYISDEEAVSSLAYEREGTYIYYSYTNSRDGAYVEFPRFYYDGYIAEDEMADRVQVYKGDHNRTRVYLKTTDTPAIIRMWYYVPRYMTLACALSFGLWVGSLMIVAVRVYRRID